MLELARANPNITKAILDHLLEALNQYCKAHPEAGAIEVFMAAHNFHVVAVLSLEQQADGINTEGQLFFRKVALETFKQAMENKPAFKRGQGSDE